MVLGGAVGRFFFIVSMAMTFISWNITPILNYGYVPSYNLKCIPKYIYTPLWITLDDLFMHKQIRVLKILDMPANT